MEKRCSRPLLEEVEPAKKAYPLLVKPENTEKQIVPTGTSLFTGFLPRETS